MVSLEKSMSLIMLCCLFRIVCYYWKSFLFFFCWCWILIWTNFAFSVPLLLNLNMNYLSSCFWLRIQWLTVWIFSVIVLKNMCHWSNILWWSLICGCVDCVAWIFFLYNYWIWIAICLGLSVVLACGWKGLCMYGWSRSRSSSFGIQSCSLVDCFSWE